MSLIEAVTIPKWGMTMTEGTITEWLAQEGDSISRGQEILEIETTKVTNVVESTASGTLRQIVLKEGTTAPIGALAGVIADEAATEAEIEAFIASYADRLKESGDADEAAAARTVAVEGGLVNLLEAGPAGDETVVFLHGFGGDLSTWLFNQPALAEKLHTVAVDLPGHGASSPASGDGDLLANVVSSVASALRDVAPGRLHLVAHSFGGAVAAALAARVPERVGSLTLLAPIGLGKQIDREFLADFVQAERRRQLQGVLERLFADSSVITNDMVEGTLRFKRLEGVPEALKALADTIADEQGQRQSIGATLAGLDCPVLLVWGSQDSIVPVPAAADIPAGINLHIIDGAGHMPQMEASAAVNELIQKNLRT